MQGVANGIVSDRITVPVGQQIPPRGVTVRVRNRLLCRMLVLNGRESVPSLPRVIEVELLCTSKHRLLGTKGSLLG